MKKAMPSTVIIIVVIIGLAVWWFNRTPAHQPDYDAATCAAVAQLGNTPVDDGELIKRIQAVISNQNSSYSVDPVKFDEDLAKASAQRYQSLSTQQKTFAGESLTNCTKTMATGAADKANQ